MEMEIINKLFLELSQVATATTGRERALAARADRTGALLVEVFNRDDVQIPGELRQRIGHALATVELVPNHG